jgi:hypothetical protein
MRLPVELARSLGASRAPFISFVKAERRRALELLATVSTNHSTPGDAQTRILAAVGATVAIYGELLASLHNVDSPDAKKPEPPSESFLV